MRFAHMYGMYVCTHYAIRGKNKQTAHNFPQFPPHFSHPPPPPCEYLRSPTNANFLIYL